MPRGEGRLALTGSSESGEVGLSVRRHECPWTFTPASGYEISKPAKKAEHGSSIDLCLRRGPPPKRSEAYSTSSERCSGSTWRERQPRDCRRRCGPAASWSVSRTSQREIDGHATSPTDPFKWMVESKYVRHVHRRALEPFLRAVTFRIRVAAFRASVSVSNPTTAEYFLPTHMCDQERMFTPAAAIVGIAKTGSSGILVARGQGSDRRSGSKWRGRSSVCCGIPGRCI